MKNKKEIIKAARNIFHLKSVVKNPKLMNPNRDWWIGLFIGFIIFIITASWSATTYISNRSPGMNIDNSIASDVVVYRASHVEAALDAYKLREDVHRRLINENYSLDTEPIIDEEELEVEVETENTDTPATENATTTEVTIDLIEPEGEDTNLDN